MRNTALSTTTGSIAFREKGFAVINGVYSSEEVDLLAACIREANSDRETFRHSGQLFAIRQFLKEVPAAFPLIFNDRLRDIVANYSSANHFPVKSIYFDKPAGSNWFVPYHQDLTISVDKRTDSEGYGPWTVKQNQFAVQAPVSILENMFTIRIHLDDTDENNGALRVLKGTHQKGIIRPESLDLTKETEQLCRVEKGGLMLMKPLLMHASSRSTNDRGRRVIHIEFSNAILAAGLQWSERLPL